MTRTLANNPQTFFNSYLSGMRNAIITTSLGVALYGFSTNFKPKTENIMKIVSELFYIYSFGISITSTLMLRDYNRRIKKFDKDSLPEYIQLKYWTIYEILGYVFSIIISILIFLATKKIFKRITLLFV